METGLRHLYGHTSWNAKWGSPHSSIAVPPRAIEAWAFCPTGDSLFAPDVAWAEKLWEALITNTAVAMITNEFLIESEF